MSETTQHEYRRPDGRTNYEAVVSSHIRKHTEDLMRGWREEGRDDEEIENIVRSCVLAAFAHGRDEGLREVANFVVPRLIGGYKT